MATDRVKRRTRKDFGLPKEERLRLASELERVVKEGRRFREGVLTAIVLKTDEPVRKVAFSVGRKVSRKATCRNKVRRWLREAYRTLKPHWRSGFWTLLVAHPGADASNFWEIRQCLQRLAIRAGLATDNSSGNREKP
ncbi:MAG: ribonuclease P protein component [Armatimonadetes bacterium]|nr:ribonuclease P protein component [Armatimonadota bacterium]MDW8120713.1 ribonuclease P protein component [Armatimonadota bacterium]